MTYSSTLNPMFRSKLSEDIFNYKYKHDGCETWEQLARTLVEDVCRDHVDKETKEEIANAISTLKFLPGGRYLYYAGRDVKYFNNCYLLRAEEDTREDWANLSWKSESCLTVGGGIGVDYSVYREKGALLKRTGGVASGPVTKAYMVNEIGRQVIQGGGRRSAIYASLNHKHPDVYDFLKAKDWYNQKIPGTSGTFGSCKEHDFNFPAPFDMTNMSVNYDTEWLMGDRLSEVFLENVERALRTGEPGFSFNFFDKENETLRNACTEVTSSDDSDVCNLGSVNLSRVEDKHEFAKVVELATIFLLCGTLVAHLPYERVRLVREKNRRLGLGLMGVHEWLLQRGYRYEVVDELHEWLNIYRGISQNTSRKYSSKLNISCPIASRAVAPTGTIGMLAGTTTGIEPVYAIAYKRRYLTPQHKWKYQYHVDTIAQQMIDLYDIEPSKIESSVDLAADYERRIKFQARIQDYVDQAISSTINLPAYGTGGNNEDTVRPFARTLAKYSPSLRGFTCYPDGARGGQPLTSVPYTEARDKLGEEFDEALEVNDACDLKSGYCGS